MSRRAGNRTRDKALKTVSELQGHLRTITGYCRILIEARTNGVDSLAQIEALDWQRFAVAVARAEVLGRLETVDRTAELIERHRTVKLFAGAFLNTFEFRGAGAVQGLLSALTIIAELYRTGKRRLPRSEEHTSELQSLMRNSYAVFCLKKKKKTHNKQ